MKFKLDEKYLNIGIHIILLVLALSFVIYTIIHLRTVSSFSWNLFKGILLLFGPVFFALFLAYLLDPIVELIHVRVFKKGDSKKRFLATLSTFLIIILILVVLGYSMSTSFRGGDGYRLIDNSISALEDFTGGFGNISGQVIDRLDDFNLIAADIFGFLDGEGFAEDFIGSVTSLVQSVGSQMISYLTKIGGYIVNIFVGLAISFYLLMDKDFMLKGWSRFRRAVFSESINKRLDLFWKEFDFVVSGYIRGQLIDVFIMGILISLVLLFLGIDYAIVIGIISGFANLIPMIGSTLATVVAVVVALAGDTPIKALYALILLIILQQIDGNIIVPKVVGKNVNLHPLMVVLSLFIFGSLFGLVGMLVAVPITALFKHFYVQFIDYKLGKRDNFME